MEHTRRTERSYGKDEAVAEAPETAMKRFKALARQLVHVDRDELRDQERRYTENKTIRHTIKKKPP
jgi:hypothetical protein